MNHSIGTNKAVPKQGGSYLEMMFQEKFGGSSTTSFESLEDPVEDYKTQRRSSWEESQGSASSLRTSIRRSGQPRRQVPSSGMRIAATAAPPTRQSSYNRAKTAPGRLERTSSRRQTRSDGMKKSLPPRENTRGGRPSIKRNKSERHARGSLKMSGLDKCSSERNLKPRNSLRSMRSLSTSFDDKVKDPSVGRSLERTRRRSISTYLPNTVIPTDKEESLDAQQEPKARSRPIRRRSLVIPQEDLEEQAVPWVAFETPFDSREQLEDQSDRKKALSRRHSMHA